MKVKYLSASNESPNKQLATEILSELIEQNPYITLQVLEDDDIVRNNYVIELLGKLRQDTVNKASALFLAIKNSLKTDYAAEQTKDYLDEIENLFQDQTFLESCDAIYLMRKENRWMASVGISFMSTLLDFELVERGVCMVNINEFQNFMGITRETHFDECVAKFGMPIRVDDSQTLYEQAVKLLNGSKNLGLQQSFPKKYDFSNVYFRDWLKIVFHEPSQQISGIEIGNVETDNSTAIRSEVELNSDFFMPGFLLGRHRDEFLIMFGEPKYKRNNLIFYDINNHSAYQYIMFRFIDDLCVQIHVLYTLR